MKATEHNFYVVLFIMLYKMVQTFKSVYETLVCYPSNQSYWAVLSQYVHVELLVKLYKLLPTLFEGRDKIKLCGTVYYN